MNKKSYEEFKKSFLSKNEGDSVDFMLVFIWKEILTAEQLNLKPDFLNGMSIQDWFAHRETGR